MTSLSRVKVEATLSSVQAVHGEARLSSVQAVHDEARLSSVHAVQIFRVKTVCQGSRVKGVARLSRIQAVQCKAMLFRVSGCPGSGVQGQRSRVKAIMEDRNIPVGFVCQRKQ